MTYITCSHPSDKIEIRKEVIKTTDILVRYEKPEPFCTKCKTYLPLAEKKTINIVNFWFINQDRKTTAVLAPC